jgi:hypothetical protein
MSWDRSDSEVLTIGFMARVRFQVNGGMREFFSSVPLCPGHLWNLPSHCLTQWGLHSGERECSTKLITYLNVTQRLIMRGVCLHAPIHVGMGLRSRGYISFHLLKIMRHDITLDIIVVMKQTDHNNLFYLYLLVWLHWNILHTSCSIEPKVISSQKLCAVRHLSEKLCVFLSAWSNSRDFQ